MSIYKTGSGSLQILLSTDISTIGLAGSRATLFKPDSGNESLPVAHSVDATGDIPVTPIGKALSVKGYRLSIMSKIDLSILGNREAREKEFYKLSSKYFLDGGIDNYKEFEADEDEISHDSEFLTVLIYKLIEFI